MRTSIWTRTFIAALGMCAAAALAAPAFGEGPVLHRDGSKAAPFVAHVPAGNGTSSEGYVLRRDGSKAVPFVANVGPNAAVSGGLSGRSIAAIGASAAFALTSLGLGGAHLVRNRRRHLERPVTIA
jgi:hypothetical protein